MRYCSTLMLMLVFFGCLLEVEFDPLILQGQNTFNREITIDRGWSIGVRLTEKDFIKLKELLDFDVECKVINKGTNSIRLKWRADDEEEKKLGKIVVDFGNYQIREIVLNPGRELLWYVGSLRGLVYGIDLSVAYPEASPEKASIFLQLEFKEIEKVKELIDISELEIPIYGERSL